MADLLPEFEQQFATVTADITAKTCILLSKDGGKSNIGLTLAYLLL